MPPKARPAQAAGRAKPNQRKAPRPAPRPAFRTAVLLPCILVFGLMIGLGDQMALILYGAMSALTALLFWLDKKQAISGGGRVSERALLTFSLLGGWPGALIVGQMIRHKTQKLGFRVPLWVVVAAHAGLWVWLLMRGQTLSAFFPGMYPA